MNTIYKIIILTIIALGFTACGSGDDGGSDGSFSSSSSSTSSTDNSIIGCSETSDIPDGYDTLNSGDTIVKESDSTEITIYYDSDGNKKVCVESGSAYIL